jgi:hypothetical protein
MGGRGAAPGPRLTSALFLRYWPRFACVIRCVLVIDRGQHAAASDLPVWEIRFSKLFLSGATVASYPGSESFFSFLWDLHCHFALRPSAFGGTSSGGLWSAVCDLEH